MQEVFSMSELRSDPITDRWVIIAPRRAKRPYSKKQAGCPFCPGNEEETPKEIRPVRTPANCPGWQVRVVPNMYNAVGIEPLKKQRVGLYSTMTGRGAHEVIIESPSHETVFENQPLDQLILILSTFKERLIDLYKASAMKQVIIFKNHGKDAGASLVHPHSQLIALPVVPIDLKSELNGARRYYKEKRSCLWCDILDQEMRTNFQRLDENDRVIINDPPKIRLVFENGSFVVFCPFVSRFPYEMHILLKRHSHYFGNIGEEEHFQETKDLAEVLRMAIKKLNFVFNDTYPEGVPYNFVIHTSPNINAGSFETIKEDFHWHIEIYPVLATPAGFEKGSGFYINTVSPEEAAKRLREVATEESNGSTCKQ